MAIQTTTFKGARYIVKFHDPIAWSADETYEAIEAVQHNGFTYISKQPVPVGVPIDNDAFWLVWADPNAQMEQLRQLVSQYVDNVEELSGVVGDLNSELATEIQNRESADNAIRNEMAIDIEKAHVFDTVANMKASQNLSVGAICHTNGFYAAGDGGAAWYEITNSGTANEMDVIACGDLFANLIANKTIKLKQLGGNVNSDILTIINYAITAYQTIVVDDMYQCSNTIRLHDGVDVVGLNQSSCGFIFSPNVFGVQIVGKNTISDITINFKNDGAGIYMYLPDNARYFMSSTCERITLIHETDDISGTCILIIGETVTGALDGAFGVTFNDIYTRNKVRYGIRVLNKVKTTAQYENWFTGFAFNNVFIHSAQIAFDCDWEDISNNNSVPHTGLASVNSNFIFNNFSAQYTAAANPICFARICNCRNVQFISSTPFDYFNAAQVFILNAFYSTWQMVSVDLGFQHEINTYSFNNNVPILGNSIKFENMGSDNFTQCFARTILNFIDSHGYHVNKQWLTQNIMAVPEILLYDESTFVYTTHPELIFNNNCFYTAFSSSGHVIIGYETSNTGIQLRLNAINTEGINSPNLHVRLKTIDSSTQSPIWNTWKKVTYQQ